MKFSLGLIVGFVAGILVTIGFAVAVDQIRNRNPIPQARVQPTSVSTTTKWRFERIGTTSVQSKLTLEADMVVPEKYRMPYIEFSCTDGKLNGFLETQDGITGGRIVLRSSFDGSEVVESYHNVSKLSRIHLKPTTAINTFRDTKTFVTSFINYEGNLVEMTFNTHGIDEFLPQLFRDCPDGE